jgi:hypothetical protein
VASAYGWVTIVILSMVKRAHPSYSNNMVVIASFPHRNMNRFSSFIISLIDSSMDQFFISSTPFCQGL